ncbi:MAG: hypothetical protein CO163_05795 [Rhodobacterales bacterium CG_4_9_14_3_um_filter_71_31]|nr:MAG: hypothetical protein CO163_05795 [Rhodobacterales bacterium CG_4_9_14_3_um_filter_71_31]
MRGGAVKPGLGPIFQELAMTVSAYRDYPYHAGGASLTRAPQHALWSVVGAIGGEHRYYALDTLWTVREWMDAAIGGPGMRRAGGRGAEVAVGDVIDSWRVLVADRPRRLAMEFGMKAPGHGVLEFDIEPVHGGARLAATAYWKPQGLAGLLYWRAMEPAHLVLFRRMTAEMCRRAERQAGDAAQPEAANTPEPAPQRG